ncbi:MAG: MATE family efflux transporter [Firmicutes bacterium]|nr:MATE family efflux transporter [Bacillota bacterium]
MEEQNKSFLADESVGKLMRKYAIPCIISLLVGALYNIVDQIFIANADYLGSYGNAANTVVFPLTIIALAVAVMLGDGCCAFVSICLGQNKSKDASKSMANSIVLTVISSIVLMAVYLIFMDRIISMFGGTVNEETFKHSKEYFFWISLGIPFYMFGQAMNPIIRADGSPRFAMASTVAGAVINIILDPIMIYGLLGFPKMGMSGAAIATVIGQIATAVLAICYLCRTKIVKMSRSDFKLKGYIICKTLNLGICSFLSQISLVAAMAAINNMLRKYGASDAVFGQTEYAQIPMAVVGIVMKFFQIVISIVVGMAAGCIPIVGYNMGAKLNIRVKKLFTMLLVSEAAVGAVGFVLVEFFPGSIINIFGAKNESVYYTEFAVKAFRTYLVFIILACINKAAFIFLQAMGKAISSTILSMVREIVLGVGFALVLPIFFGLDGVLYSMPVSDLLTAVLSAVIIFMTYRELGKKTEIEQSDN